MEVGEIHSPQLHAHCDMTSTVRTPVRVERSKTKSQNLPGEYAIWFPVAAVLPFLDPREEAHTTLWQYRFDRRLEDTFDHFYTYAAGAASALGFGWM